MRDSIERPLKRPPLNARSMAQAVASPRHSVQQATPQKLQSRYSDLCSAYGLVAPSPPRLAQAAPAAAPATEPTAASAAESAATSTRAGHGLPRPSPRRRRASTASLSSAAAASSASRDAFPCAAGPASASAPTLNRCASRRSDAMACASCASLGRAAAPPRLVDRGDEVGEVDPFRRVSKQCDTLLPLLHSAGGQRRASALADALQLSPRALLGNAKSEQALRCLPAEALLLSRSGGARNAASRSSLHRSCSREAAAPPVRSYSSPGRSRGSTGVDIDSGVQSGRDRAHTARLRGRHGGRSPACDGEFRQKLGEGLKELRSLLGENQELRHLLRQRKALRPSPPAPAAGGDALSPERAGSEASPSAEPEGADSPSPSEAAQHEDGVVASRSRNRFREAFAAELQPVLDDALMRARRRLSECVQAANEREAELRRLNDTLSALRDDAEDCPASTALELRCSETERRLTERDAKCAEASEARAVLDHLLGRLQGDEAAREVRLKELKVELVEAEHTRSVLEGKLHFAEETQQVALDGVRAMRERLEEQRARNTRNKASLEARVQARKSARAELGDGGGAEQQRSMGAERAASPRERGGAALDEMTWARLSALTGATRPGEVAAYARKACGALEKLREAERVQRERRDALLAEKEALGNYLGSLRRVASEEEASPVIDAHWKEVEMEACRKEAASIKAAHRLSEAQKACQGAVDQLLALDGRLRKRWLLDKAPAGLRSGVQKAQSTMEAISTHLGQLRSSDPVASAQAAREVHSIVSTQLVGPVGGSGIAEAAPGKGGGGDAAGRPSWTTATSRPSAAQRRRGEAEGSKEGLAAEARALWATQLCTSVEKSHAILLQLWRASPEELASALPDRAVHLQSDMCHRLNRRAEPPAVIEARLEAEAKERWLRAGAGVVAELRGRLRGQPGNEKSDGLASGSAGSAAPAQRAGAIASHEKKGWLRSRSSSLETERGREGGERVATRADLKGAAAALTGEAAE